MVSRSSGKDSQSTQSSLASEANQVGYLPTAQTT